MFHNYPIKLIQNEFEGRYVIADRDLDVGEVVLKAKSYLSVGSEGLKRFACHNCVKLHVEALELKCELCREIFWCNDLCKNENYKAHNTYECKYFRSMKKPTINKDKFDMETFTEIRMLVSMLSRYYHHKILGHPEEHKLSENGLVLIEDPEDPLGRPYISNQIGQVFDLVENEINDKTNSAAKGLIDKLVVYIKDLFYDVLFQWKVKKGYNPTELELEQFNRLQDVVRPLIAKIRCNQFGIWSKKDKCIGVAVSPVSSYFNHSCIPNCVDVRDGRTMVFRTLFPVKKDTPLCISYIELEATHESRFFDLVFSYFFRCRCLRCLDDSGVTDDWVAKFTCRNTSHCSGLYYFNFEKYQINNNINNDMIKYNEPIELVCTHCDKRIKIDKKIYFLNYPTLKTIKLRTNKQLDFDLD